MRSTNLLTIAALVLTALITLTGGAVAHESTPAAGIPANLAPPSTSTLLFELHAEGVQIYACEADPEDATEFVWTFKAPEANLLNQNGDVVGTHFAGPTWQGNDGSAIVAAVLERADSPDATAIPWLLLEAKEHSGAGIFSTITHIQRLDTISGIAPTDGCDADQAGAEIRQPYEATYAFFYPSAPSTPDTATPST